MSNNLIGVFKDSILFCTISLKDKIKIDSLRDNNLVLQWYFEKKYTHKNEEKFRIKYWTKDSFFRLMNRHSKDTSYQRYVSKCKDCKRLNRFFQKHNIMYHDIYYKSKFKWIRNLVYKALVNNYVGKKTQFIKRNFKWSSLKYNREYIHGIGSHSYYDSIAYEHIIDYNKSLYVKLGEFEDIVNRMIFVNVSYKLFGVINFYKGEKGYLKVTKNYLYPEVLIYQVPMKL